MSKQNIWKKIGNMGDGDELSVEEEQAFFEAFRDASDVIETLKMHPRHQRLKERLQKAIESEVISGLE
jgi:hypothetical protein